MQSQWKVEVVGRVYYAKVSKGASSLGGFVGCSVSLVFSGNTAAFCWGKSVGTLCCLFFSRVSRAFLAIVACFFEKCCELLIFGYR